MDTFNNPKLNSNFENQDKGNVTQTKPLESAIPLSGSTGPPSLDTHSSQITFLFEALKSLEELINTQGIIQNEHAQKIQFTYDSLTSLDQRIVAQEDRITVIEKTYTKPPRQGKFAIAKKQSPEISSLKSQLKNVKSVEPNIDQDGFPLFNESNQQKHKEISEIRKRIRLAKKSSIDPTKPRKPDPLAHVKGRNNSLEEICLIQQEAIKHNKKDIACPIHMSAFSGACSHSLTTCNTIGNWNLALRDKLKYCIFHKSHNHPTKECKFLQLKCNKHNEEHILGTCPTLWRLLLSKEKSSH